MISKPFLINFPKIGDDYTGFISVCEKHNLPFKTKRVYWTYNTNTDVVRGHHAHYHLSQILVAVVGNIHVYLELITGEKFNFILDSPNVGLFIPKMSWHTMKYGIDSVQMCIASMEYDENDYIRNYDDFKRYMDN